MNHRHLLPDEVDQLVDGESGFGVAPLRGHLDECSECRERAAHARIVVDLLERLPRLEPSSRFGDRVIADVHVFEPWYVSLREAVERLAPRSVFGRGLAAVGALTVASVVTAIGAWLIARGDVVAFLVEVATDNIRDVVANRGPGAARAVIDASGATAPENMGLAAIAVVLTTVLGTVIASTLWLRTLATASARRRDV